MSFISQFILQANNPVCVGKARSCQQRLCDGDYSLDESATHGDKVLCVQVHGDGAVAAQVSLKKDLDPKLIMKISPH
jgi:hypothetical protein